MGGGGRWLRRGVFISKYGELEKEAWFSVVRCFRITSRELKMIPQQLSSMSYDMGNMMNN